MGRKRIAVQLDAVAAKIFDIGGDHLSSEEGLGFLRIVSTPTILQDMLGEAEPSLGVGDWVKLTVSSNLKKAGPRVWSLQLRNDQFVGGGEGGLPTRGKLIQISRLATASQPVPPHPLGASVPATLTKGSALKNRYSLLNVAPTIAPAALNGCLRQWSRIWALSKPIARDVGQANFNVIYPHSMRPGPTLYFDVGQPIWFHLHNLPPAFFAHCPKDSMIILSHWDTDHYAYGRQHPEFHELQWIAPAQASVGPNAHTFARKLRNLGRLQLVETGRSSRHRRGARIIRCSGSSMNGSGLALHLRTLGRNVLFTGDADYDEIPSMRGVRLSGLQYHIMGGVCRSLRLFRLRLNNRAPLSPAVSPIATDIRMRLPSRATVPPAGT